MLFNFGFTKGFINLITLNVRIYLNEFFAKVMLIVIDFSFAKSIMINLF